MNYKEFECLYIGDRVVFTMGLELLLENGRDAIVNHTERELIQFHSKQLGGFFAPEKVVEIVRTAKSFAEMKTAVLMAYICRCGTLLDGVDLDMSGVCPVCGGPLIYGENAAADTADSVGWTCQDCGATGEEVYRQAFDSHQDVRLGDGRPVPPREM